jgi:hypothetical protein
LKSLYELTRHEKLGGAAWDPDIARNEIKRIIEDFGSARLSAGNWPTHPLDDEGLAPKWALYSGAAGAVVSLRILRNAGHAAIDHSDSLNCIHASYLLHPDYGYETGLQLGEIGILTPAVLANLNDTETTERLVDCMKKTIHNQAREITSGVTGMMHAALTLFQKTHNEIWRELYCEGAQALWESWTQNGETGEWHWQSHIFGAVRTYYGACHGIAGNVHALLRGKEFLPNHWEKSMVQRAAHTLSHGSVRHGTEVNWPLSSETDPVGKKHLVQWCHGAPGIVMALSTVTSGVPEDADKLADLVNDAAEMVWIAGPLTKGPGICHGTSGNGYAFLARYQRTGQAHWLDRARQYGMHAIEQSRHTRNKYGQGRYTLWTGDSGLAIYLHHCLNPKHIHFPGLEEF